MSETCHRGYKCMCFQCRQKDCDKYEPEPPKWVEELIKNERVEDLIMRMKSDDRL